MLDEVMLFFSHIVNTACIKLLLFFFADEQMEVAFKLS